MALVLAATGLLAAADRGALDDQIARFASQRLKRQVVFQTFHSRLLSARPTIEIRGLRIANPAWAGPTNLLEVNRLDLGFRWGDLLLARLTPYEVSTDGVTANLVRATRTQTNWSSGKGGGGGRSKIRRLRITNARFVLDDRVHDLHVAGALSQEPERAARFPMSATAQGVLKGAEVTVSMRGGPLNGRPISEPYPFTAELRDGATVVEARGVSDKPFSFRGFDLAVATRGPNLADMKYVIGVGLPNSAPYSLTGRIVRKGRTTRATGLKATVGRSDLAGAIISDGSRPRRMLTVELTSRILHAADLGAFFKDVPPHAVARSVSGVTPAPTRPRLFSDERIDLTRFRIRDARLKLAADRFLIDGAAPARLTAQGVLDHGRFELKPVRMDFASGRADAVVGLELNGPVPAFRIDTTVRGPLAGIVPSLATSLNGAADLRVRASGAGESWRRVALAAEGQVTLSIRNGDIQAAKAKVLSGSVLQGALTALANKSARAELNCAVAALGVGDGKIRADRILLVTDAGVARIDGQVDLASETIDMTVRGRPARRGLFSISKPISIQGPMLRPQTKLRVLGGDKDSAADGVEIPKPGDDRVAFCDQLLRAKTRP